MKVFTVGLDQKPPPTMVEKSESPPPGYQSNVAMPLPMGPEVAPIIVRKSRGYKGILLVMLGVFLMAVFALTLSEIAYNRQRDENFFRLQWAQLKHRLGYEFEYPHRIIPINRTPEFGEPLAQRGEEAAPADTTTTTEGPRRIFIDTGAMPASSADSSATSSSERDTPENFVRDARLQFLKSILQKIKQNAEEMGFDGTMQVSVIEVEPQTEILNAKPPKGAFGASEDPRSDSFLDSFGEFHAPSPFGQQSSQLSENSIIEPSNNGRGRWQPQEFGAFEMPMAQFQQQQMPYRPEMMMGGFRPAQEWNMQRPEMEEHWHPSEGQFEVHPKSNEFGASPSQEIMGEMYGRKFGRMLQDLIAARIQNSIMQQQQQNQMMNPMLQLRPSFPIESAQIQQSGAQFPPIPPVQNAQPPTSQFMGQQQSVQQPQSNNQQPQMPPLPPTSIQDTQSKQPEQQQFGQGFPQPSPQFPVFIAPEDRIQIEPPNQMNGGGMWQSPQAQESQQQPDSKQPAHIVDFMSAPRDIKAWTHQSESAPSSLIDGEVQMPAEDVATESQDNKLVILKKPTVDGEKNEEFGAPTGRQLAAAAAAALAAQHRRDMEQQAPPQPAPFSQQRNSDDVFKSLEQSVVEEPQQNEKSEDEQHREVKPQPQQQQSVEPAPIVNERNDETSEQVDFPAVKFPNMASDAVGSPMHDLPEQAGSSIFFQVDEPQQQQQRSVAGLV
ncbi:hypothetical protein M3Y98_00853800 [Aphelenchoides besseyi]|nr:hypothetical protein M3Y98_00853800 [Aphelenchoides besseyi]